MRRWLATEGKYGEPPEDWTRFQIAKYCNCKPWELPDVPLWWQFKAVEYMSGEAEAEQMIADRNRNRSR